MKENIDVRQIPPSVASDSGPVRIGSLSPAFPAVRVTPINTSDSGKIRIGSLSPSLPPRRNK